MEQAIKKLLLSASNPEMPIEQEAVKTLLLAPSSSQIELKKKEYCNRVLLVYFRERFLKQLQLIWHFRSKLPSSTAAESMVAEEIFEAVKEYSKGKYGKFIRTPLNYPENSHLHVDFKDRDIKVEFDEETEVLISEQIYDLYD